MLKHEYSIAKFGLDTAENGPPKPEFRILSSSAELALAFILQILHFKEIQWNYFVDFEKCWKMSIWLLNLALIQPKTSSEYVLRCGPRAWTAGALVERLEDTSLFPIGSISAVSRPNFAIKYSFFSIFQNLEYKLTEFSKFVKICQIFFEFCKILLIFHHFSGFCKFCWFFHEFVQNFCKFCIF